MPIYEYQCKNCMNKYEELFTSFTQAKEEEPILTCSKCGSLEKDRLVNTGTSFELKGNGWAKDLYSGSNRRRGKNG